MENGQESLWHLSVSLNLTLIIRCMEILPPLLSSRDRVQLAPDILPLTVPSQAHAILGLLAYTPRISTGGGPYSNSSDPEPRTRTSRCKDNLAVGKIGIQGLLLVNSTCGNSPQSLNSFRHRRTERTAKELIQCL
jgi:hypothetical protein